MTQDGQSVAEGQGATALPRRKKVAIVGFADGHRHLAPFDDGEYDIWGINRLHAVQEGRWDSWYEIHPLHVYDEDTPENVAHRKFLMTFPGPVWLRPADVGVYNIPNARPYPVDHIVRKFGHYFNNTISWLLAHAIDLEYETVAIYGVDMAQDSQLGGGEYSHQRPSCEYFIGVARGLGIEVEIPEGSDLLKTTHLYGIEETDGYRGRLMSRLNELGKRKEEAKTRVAQLRAEANKVEGVVQSLDGAMQQCIYETRAWLPPVGGG
jgi:hypothetical protein